MRAPAPHQPPWPPLPRQQRGRGGRPGPAAPTLSRTQWLAAAPADRQSQPAREVVLMPQSSVMCSSLPSVKLFVMEVIITEKITQKRPKAALPTVVITTSPERTQAQ